MPITPIEELSAKFDILFAGRRDVYGVLRPDGTIECVKQTRSWRHMAAHLSGEQSLAVYPVLDDGTCWWVCVDFDCKDDPEKAFEEAGKLQAALAGSGVRSWLERSKSKGYHVWVFFSEKVEAALARSLARAALSAAGILQGIGKGVLVEIFPKQDTLAPGQVGNCMNLPYFGADVAEGKRVVVEGNPGLLTAEEFSTAALAGRLSGAKAREVFGKILERIEERRAGPKDDHETDLPGESVERLAKILLPYWTPQQRHYLALGVAGTLAKRGFKQKTAENLVKKITRDAKDEEAADRLAAVEGTYRRMAESKDVAGLSYLTSYLPVGAVKEFLSALAAEKASSSAETLDEDVRVIDDAGGPAFLAKPPVKGLLKDLCDYFALSTDANLEVRMAAALVLLSLLVGRRVWLWEGRRTTFPNLWMFVIGPSSDTRKSTLQGLCRDLWDEVVKDETVAAHMFPERTEDIETGIKDDEKPAGIAVMKNPIWNDDFSPEALAHKMALITAVCKYTVGTIFSDEAAWYLEALQKKDYMANLIGQMLKLYDCPRRTGFERRQGGRRSEYRIENVFVNWFLVTTPQNLADAATNRLRYSGFFQRCCLVPAGPREKEPEDFQPPVPDEVTQEIVEKLRRVASFGPAGARFSDGAREIYHNFVKELRKFRQENANLLEAELLARLDSITKKLAIIMEVALRAENGEIGEHSFFFDEGFLSGDEDLVISEEAAHRAVGLARYFWKATAFVAENLLASSEFMAERRLVMDALQREGGECSKSTLLRRTKLTVKKLDEILETLVARKEVVVENFKNKGRGPKGKKIKLY